MVSSGVNIIENCLNSCCSVGLPGARVRLRHWTIKFFYLTARMTNSEQPQVMHHNILLLQTVLILRKAWTKMLSV